MATLEDKLLGEKLQYYCSSSEDEGEEDNDEGEGKLTASTIRETPEASQEIHPWDGTSANTGPKGVLKDWQRFKQLEQQQNRDQEKERIMLAKKLSMSCQSHLDEEKAKQIKQQQEEEDVDKMLDEHILHEYIQKRMKEMLSLTEASGRKKFGKLLNLETSHDLLEAIDKEDKKVTVIIHLFEKSAQGCEAMNGCLHVLAEEYPSIKFCKLKASAAGVSSRFQGYGLPALLVYKAGQMMSNFVRLVDEFGDDFFATDVESFLVEHGILQDSSLVPPTIKNSSIVSADD